MNMPFDQSDIDLIIIENTGEERINYRVYISSADQTNFSSGRSVHGSYLYCPDKIVNSGETYEIELSLYNSSMDNEWIKDVIIEFPLGIELESATNFVGGTDDLVFEGELGNGATANWHGENNDGWGVLQGGQFAVATITISVDESYSEHFDLQYEIHGDIYGDEPHVMLGELPFRNLGERINWLGLDQSEGQIEGGGINELNLYFDTWDMEVGFYNCSLLLLDNFNNEYIIPVVLEVEQYVNDDELQNAEEELQL